MLSVRSKSPNAYQVIIGEQTVELVVRAHEGARMVLEGGGKQFVTQAVLAGATLFASIDGASFTCSNALMRNAANEEVGDGSRVTAPMHGRVIDVFVAKGDAVTAGDRLAIIEAMKMQHEILAGVDGTVEDVLVVADAQVAADDLMIALDTGDE
jgi:geranyl-CoA carboxylase alpha subunit